MSSWWSMRCEQIRSGSPHERVGYVVVVGPNLVEGGDPVPDETRVLLDLVRNVQARTGSPESALSANVLGIVACLAGPDAGGPVDGHTADDGGPSLATPRRTRTIGVRSGRRPCQECQGECRRGRDVAGAHAYPSHAKDRAEWVQTGVPNLPLPGGVGEDPQGPFPRQNTHFGRLVSSNPSTCFAGEAAPTSGLIPLRAAPAASISRSIAPKRLPPAANHSRICVGRR